MRTDQEMMALIRERAQRDPRVLAAYLKGSRTNPKVPRDIYQDFDVMYVVRETESFLADPSWLESFGEILLKQEEKDDFGYGERFGIRGRSQESYSWLLLFADGTRIDLGIETLPMLERGSNRNGLFLPILDKVGCLPSMPPPTDREFYVRKPTKKRFEGCCNEFFWCLCDVAKGIARDELPLVMGTYNTLVRNMLEQMLQWYVGSEQEYQVSCGKGNKFLKRYLPQELYERYVRTFSDGDYQHLWKAIEEARILFGLAGRRVAQRQGFIYLEESEQGFLTYARWVRQTMEH